MHVGGALRSAGGRRRRRIRRAQGAAAGPAARLLQALPGDPSALPVLQLAGTPPQPRLLQGLPGASVMCLVQLWHSHICSRQGCLCGQASAAQLGQRPAAAAAAAATPHGMSPAPLPVRQTVTDRRAVQHRAVFASGDAPKDEGELSTHTWNGRHDFAGGAVLFGDRGDGSRRVTLGMMAETAERVKCALACRADCMRVATSAQALRGTTKTSGSFEGVHRAPQRGGGG